MVYQKEDQKNDVANTQAFDEYVDFARRYSPFYAELYKDHSCISATNAPVVEHSHYWDKNGYMHSKVMTGPQIDGIVLRTGGTTSKPKFTAYSQIELQKTAGLLAEGLIAAGLLPGDRVGNLFYAGECYGSYLLHILSIAALPIPAIQVPIGGQIPEESMEQLINHCKVNVLLSTPTTLISLAKRGLKHQTLFPGIRLVLFSGEPMFSDQLSTLRSVFPKASFKSCIYGSIDAGVVATSTSDPDPRVHRVVPGIIAEIQADDTDQTFTKDNGVEGRLIVTNLLRRLTPVIRYPTGDRAEWVNRTDGVFRLLGRDSHSLRLGPVSLDINALRHIVVEALPEVSLVAFQAVLLRQDGKDLLQCCIDADTRDEKDARSRVLANLRRERPMLADHIDTGHIAEPAVTFMPITEMVVNRTTGKALPIVDRRDIM